ncbi:hypothetical protein [Duganella violaceipulchra]|uniref:Uncharacterized protein n=1 Tax=Duganella violaceipulchra TaxID=2849652 RepID=A0AA41H968_9BURK|nr:hypothetical protein [Duganella violaceicalia]MBV6324382.1 hypothetical protein [Duganella violaceicalia]MCP2011984.1 hypothetical protein [Duganella violaceicalia]
MAEATANTPFLPGSVYPVGIDKIHIGSTREQVAEAFPNAKWTEDDYVSVQFNHTLFSSAAYYFSGDKKKRYVSSILFFFGSKSPLTTDAIKNRFSILFGPPAATSRRGENWWRATPREVIVMDVPGTYSVRLGSYVPYWASTNH